MIEPAEAADPPQQRLTLFSGPCDTTSPLAVRQQLAALSRRPVPTRLLETCQLIAIELVSNAVKADADWLDVDLLLYENYLELWVTDEADGVPEQHQPSVNDTGGRGLQIVAALAAAWGFRTEPAHGKTVWARLNLPAMPPPRLTP